MNEPFDNVYQSLLHSVGLGFHISELLYDQQGQPVDWRFLEVNDTFEQQTGLHNVIGQLGSQLAPATEAYWLQAYDQVLKTGQSIRLESYNQATQCWYAAYATRIGPAHNQQFAVVFDDITNQKYLEQQQAYLLMLSDALRSITDPIEIEQTVTRIALQHFAADRCYYCRIEDGQAIITRDAMRGDLPSVAGSYPLSDFVLLTNVVDAGQPFAVDDAATTPILDEEIRAVCLHMQVISFLNVPVVKQGQVVGVLCTVQSAPRQWTQVESQLAIETAERTWAAVERARAEKALREGEKKYRTLFENMEQGYALGEVIRDAQGRAIDLRYLELNPAFERLSGIHVAQAQGRTVREVYGTVEPEWFEVADRVARQKAPERVEYEIGAIGRWFEMHFYPAEGDRYLGLYQDVTDRKRREANLAFLAEVSQDLARLTTIDETMKALGTKIGAHFQVVNVAFGEVDEPHEVMTVAHEWHATDALSFVGQYRIRDFLDDDLRHTMRAGKVWVMSDVLNDARANAQSIAVLGIGAMASVPFAREGEWLFNLTLYDRQARHWREDEIELLRETASYIWTRLERARAEEALHESQKRFESIANLVPDLLWDSNPDGSTTWYNQRWLDYIGQRLEQAIGWGWTQAIHPDDRAASARRYREAVASGQSLRQEHRIRRHDGAYRWFVVNTALLKDPTGQVIKVYGAATDIHESRLARAA